MRCFGLVKQKNSVPVGDIDLKSPSVRDRRKVPERAMALSLRGRA
jgi:hypothetical protein